jgi:hypothetical protein
LGVGVTIDNDKLSVLAYTDDIALIGCSEEELQILIDYLDTWCKKWYLEISAEKSQVVHFRPNSVPRSTVEFMCGECRLQLVSCYKYLGLVLTEYLDYKVTAKTVAQAATRALGVLIAKSKANGGLPFQTYTKLYDSLVWPIVDYGAVVWGMQVHSSIESVHNKACRFFMGVGRYTPNAAVRGDMGWYTPKERIMTCVTRHWIRCHKQDSEFCNHQIFKWCIKANHRQRRHINWCGRFSAIADNLGLAYLKEDEQVQTRFKSDMIREFRQKIAGQVVGEWKQQLAQEQANRGQGHNKLRLYRRFKSDLAPEPYLTRCVNRLERRALAKFRCGVAPLALETGRYRQIAVEDRTCFNCSGKIENEMHVLAVCPLYNDLRQCAYTKIVGLVPGFGILNDWNKVDTLLSDPRSIKPSAKFCYDILERRRALLQCE